MWNAPISKRSNKTRAYEEEEGERWGEEKRGMRGERGRERERKSERVIEKRKSVIEKRKLLF